MKRYIAFLLAVAMSVCLFSGCQDQPREESLPAESTGQTTEPAEETVQTQAQTEAPSVPETTEQTETPSVPAETEQTTAPQQENAGYLQKIEREDQSIFDGPSYDHKWVGTVEVAGTYTIMEEVTDDEGNLWGRLKSGAGWVDLTDIRAWDPAKTPISANFVDDRLLAEGNYEHCIADTSEYMVQIAFRVYDKLYDFSLVSLQIGEDGYEVAESYFMLPVLEKSLVADLAFPGDLSAYGISFTDSQGNSRQYIVTLSGRNGTVVLSEETS